MTKSITTREQQRRRHAAARARERPRNRKPDTVKSRRSAPIPQPIITRSFPTSDLLTECDTTAPPSATPTDVHIALSFPASPSPSPRPSGPPSASGTCCRTDPAAPRKTPTIRKGRPRPDPLVQPISGKGEQKDGDANCSPTPARSDAPGHLPLFQPRSNLTRL